MSTPTDTSEIDPIERWLLGLGLPDHDLEPLPGDVSSRTYYRVRRGCDTFIVAHYPKPLLEACSRFAIANHLLDQQGVRVPRIHATDDALGLMLLEDLGTRTLFDLCQAGNGNLRHLQKEATRLISRIASISPQAVSTLNPDLDLELFRAEVMQTFKVFLQPRRLCGSSRQEDELLLAIDRICRALSEAPRLPCHRDFMARNLIPVEGSRGLAVIDHQDMRLGPAAYDLACLFNDSMYVQQDVVDQLLESDVDRDLYHRCAVQRTLKIVGTFVSFAQRGSERHLALVPPSLEKCLEHLALLPEGEPLVRDLRKLWQPALGGRSF